MNFNASKCRGTWLHKYYVISNTEEQVFERCLRCGKKLVFKLYNGVPKATLYAENHMREFLVPQHRLFKHEYA